MTMLRRAMVLLIVLTVAAACATGGGGQDSRAAAHQSVLNTAKAFDLAMTLVGQAYRANVFGVPGSPAAERIRQQASQASRTVSALVSSAIAALEAGKDPTSYLNDISAAIAQVQTLLTPVAGAGHASFHLPVRITDPPAPTFDDLQELQRTFVDPPIYFGGVR